MMLSGGAACLRLQPRAVCRQAIAIGRARTYPGAPTAGMVDETAFLKDLSAAYRRFEKGGFLQNQNLWKDLAANGQKPRSLVIACSDSRVEPAHLFDSRPGEFFVVRNVANVCPGYQKNTTKSHHGTSAALEFAVNFLRVEAILVLGHRFCGGVRAMMEKDLQSKMDKTDFIGSWMRLAASAKDRAVQQCLKDNNFDELLLRAELEVVKLSVENLQTFPCIKHNMGKGRLQVHGLHFDFTDGKAMLRVLDKKSGTFSEMDSFLSSAETEDLAKHLHHGHVEGGVCCAKEPLGV